MCWEAEAVARWTASLEKAKYAWFCLWYNVIYCDIIHYEYKWINLRYLSKLVDYFFAGLIPGAAEEGAEESLQPHEEDKVVFFFFFCVICDIMIYCDYILFINIVNSKGVCVFFLSLQSYMTATRVLCRAAARVLFDAVCSNWHK